MMFPPREIKYKHCDYAITEDAISDIEDDSPGIWLQNTNNDKQERKQRRKSRKSRSNQRHRQERRLSLSNDVDTTLNECNGTTTDALPSIPKQRSDFISPSSKRRNDDENEDDGTRKPSSTLDNRNFSGFSRKMVDSPPFAPQRKKSVSGGIGKSLVSTRFLQSVGMAESSNHDNKVEILTNNKNRVLPYMGPEEVCVVLDYFVGMDI